MNEIITKENIKIEDMIFEIRGKQVMLDSDLALLYECKNGTKSINLAVKRHINRFPERYMFKLTREEYYDILRFQNETLELKQGKYNKFTPYVFTEQGVAMLSAVLKTPIAEQISIRIMDAFVAMRKYVSYNLINSNNYSDILIDYEGRIKALESTFSKFDTFSNELFFEGQIYDAHSLLLDIFNTSKKSIVIIDNYISKELLDVLSKTNKDVIIHTKNIDLNLIKKYQSQYNNITIKINESFHDRFIIIDNKDLYHCGASFKDLGKKCFAINKIEDINILKELKSKL